MEDNALSLNNSAKVVAEGLFSLRDPWRDRFLAFVAERALGNRWDGQPPTKRDVTNWLAKESLHQTMVLLLGSWQGHANAADGTS